MILVIKIYLNVILQGLYNMGKKKIKNSTSPKKQIKTEQPTENTNNTGFFIDLSFEGLYYSVDDGDFTNYLQNSEDFVKKFKEIRKLLSKISGKNFIKDLVNMKHCHIIENDKRNKVVSCICESLKRYDSNKNIEDFKNQLLDGKIYQMGFEGPVRIVGTYNNNGNNGLFRVYLIDYHHRLFFDEKRNTMNTKNYRFCPMTSE